MLIHNDFVFIHLPKTGGTFVTKTLQKVYVNGLRNRALPKKVYDKILVSTSLGEYEHKVIHLKLDQRVPNLNEEYGQHGGCNEIPEKYKNKPIYSIIRNPYDYYFSLYKFRWWATYPILSESENKQFSPNFPNLTFTEFLEYTNTVYLTKHLGYQPKSIGFMTWKFIRFYCRKPNEVAKLLDSNPDLDITRFMFPINWLHTETLNDDLYNMLLANDYNPSDINFIQDLDKIRPKSGKGTRTDNDRWQDSLGNQDILTIEEKDKTIFRLFPHYNDSV